METEEGSRLVKQALKYLIIGAISFLAITFLERLAAGLLGHILMTEIYSIHGFSHVFFGIGLVAIVLFFRPRSSARAGNPCSSPNRARNLARAVCHFAV
jgi:hypothetical protein